MLSAVKLLHTANPRRSFALSSREACCYRVHLAGCCPILLVHCSCYCLLASHYASTAAVSPTRFLPVVSPDASWVGGLDDGVARA